jgi:hypothetical protein
LERSDPNAALASEVRAYTLRCNGLFGRLKKYKETQQNANKLKAKSTQEK